MLVKVIISSFFVVQSLSCVRLFVTSWTAAHQTSLSSPISWSLLKFMSIELVILSNHLILCCCLLLLPSIFPIIGVFSSELALCTRWPKHWSFSFSISPSNENSVLIFLGLTGLISLLSTLRVYYLPCSYISQFYMSSALLITFFRFLVVPQSCCFSIYILRIWEFLTVFPNYVSFDFTFFSLYFTLYFYWLD